MVLHNPSWSCMILHSVWSYMTQNYPEWSCGPLHFNESQIIKYKLKDCERLSEITICRACFAAKNMIWPITTVFIFQELFIFSSQMFVDHVCYPRGVAWLFGKHCTKWAVKNKVSLKLHVTCSWSLYKLRKLNTHIILRQILGTEKYRKVINFAIFSLWDYSRKIW